MSTTVTPSSGLGPEFMKSTSWYLGRPGRRRRPAPRARRDREPAPTGTRADADRVPEETRDRVLLDVAVAAVHLDGVDGHLDRGARRGGRGLGAVRCGHVRGERALHQGVGRRRAQAHLGEDRAQPGEGRQSGTELAPVGGVGLRGAQRGLGDPEGDRRAEHRPVPERGASLRAAELGPWCPRRAHDGHPCLPQPGPAGLLGYGLERVPAEDEPPSRRHVQQHHRAGSTSIGTSTPSAGASAVPATAGTVTPSVTPVPAAALPESRTRWAAYRAASVTATDGEIRAAAVVTAASHSSEFGSSDDSSARSVCPASRSAASRPGTASSGSVPRSPRCAPAPSGRPRRTARSPGRGWSSGEPRPVRFAALLEGRRQLGALLCAAVGREQQVVGEPGLAHDAGVPAGERGLERGERERPAAPQVLGDLDSPLDDSAVLGDLVDQPHREGLLGRVLLVEEPHLLGATTSDGLLEVPGAETGVEAADERTDLTEDRVRGGDGQVADHLQDVPPADP